MKLQIHNPNAPHRGTPEPNYFHSLQQQSSTRAMPLVGVDDSHANSGLSASPITGVQTGGFSWTNVPYRKG